MPLTLNRFPDEVAFVAARDFNFDDQSYAKGDVIPDAKTWMKLEILVRNRYVIPVIEDRNNAPKMFYREVKTPEAAEHILRMPINWGDGGESEETFDPSEHTISQVLAYVQTNPDRLYAVYEAEESGKNRSTLIRQLEDLIAEQEGQ